MFSPLHGDVLCEEDAGTSNVDVQIRKCPIAYMFSLQKELFKNWRYVFFWTGHFHSVKLLVYAYWNDADSKSHFATQADKQLDSAHPRVKSSCHFLLFP